MLCNIFNDKLVTKNTDAVCLLTDSISRNIHNNMKKNNEKNNERNKLYMELIKKTDLFSSSTDAKNKKKYMEDIKRMYNNPLFDKNNSKYFNNIWKYNSNYFLDYDKTILNPVIEHIFSKHDDSLIRILLKDGLIYVDKLILCVNPSLYSHSAIIVKFNKPIQFEDSSFDVSGILYSFSIKARTNNSKITFWDKIINRLKQLLSFLWNQKAYMTRILLTSDDFSKMEKNNGNNIFKLSNVDGRLVKNSINITLDSLKTFGKLSENSLIGVKELNSDIEKISYFFSLYAKNTINHISRDRIVSYKFRDNNVSLELGWGTVGLSIYDFVSTDCSKLKLTNKEKLSVVKEFLRLECLKLLKENKIIDKNSDKFSINDFYKLPKIKPNDLKRKFCYPKMLVLDLNYDFKSNSTIDEADVANTGRQILSGLEKLNRKPTNYSFFNNNCLTVLKEILLDCGNNNLKTLIKNTDKRLNWVKKRHPDSFFNELKESANSLNIKI